MVGHDILVHGSGLSGVAAPKRPVILQMHDDDFPARFLHDLATQDTAQPVSSAAPVTGSPPLLFQPVQRMLNLALIQLNCNSLAHPRVDPARVLSAGLVVRRSWRQPGTNGGPSWDDPHTCAAWMRNAQGQWAWVKLSKLAEDLDPDPARRLQLQSGDPLIDSKLAAMAMSTAMTESTTPAFAAPPATCAALGRTVLYAVVPTASSQVSDMIPQAPALDPAELLNTLPRLLRSAQGAPPPHVPVPGAAVDYHWLNDEVLNTLYPPTGGGAPPATRLEVSDFRDFTLALRMLATVFGAFDPTPEGQAVLAILNRHSVAFDASPQPDTMGMGDFYAWANSSLLNFQAYPSASAAGPTVTMPLAWDWLNDADELDLGNALNAALIPRFKTLLAPQGRFQDDTRRYRLRLFVRLKGDQPHCPPQLVWSDYSEEFLIAPWHATGERTHPPVPLPDPTSAFLKKAKPNCSFQVPGNLMSAVQGTSMSGLLKGAGGGGGLGVQWICGFNIPLITICAFFVLNIFLTLLNLVFFWLPFIKICIPFPAPSSTDHD